MLLLAKPGIAQTDSSLAPLPVFELHSGFWINLHHTLYEQAREQRGSRSSAAKSSEMTQLTEPERATWDAAVAYYVANFAN